MKQAEEAVGISGFLGQHRGFSGLLKHRWDDFHVHEVGENGEVRHLTQLISRSDVLLQMKSKEQLERGEEFIQKNFKLESTTRQKLLTVGFFTINDIQIVEQFISHLAYVGDFSPEDLSTAKPSLQNENSDSRETTLETHGKQQQEIIDGQLERSGEDKPVLQREKISLKTPPYCLILGDFEKCARSLIKKNVDQKLPPPTENQVWKELRRCIHCSIREVLPFMCSSTLTTDELCTITGVSADQLTLFHIPTVQPFIENNPTIGNKLQKFSMSTTSVLNQCSPYFSPPSESSKPIDQFSRVIQLCPKPSCLFLLFRHLQRNNRRQGHADRKDQREQQGKKEQQEQKEQQSSELLGCNDPSQGDNKTTASFALVQQDEKHIQPCNCHIRKRKSVARRKRNQLSPAADGVCQVCGGKPREQREPRLASHFERWPKDRPSYLYFHMWKINRDTAEAINMIAVCIGCNPKVFTFAGTKDKRAVTVQAVTAFRVSIQQIHKAMLHPRWDRNVRISDLRYQHERVSLGSLHGNNFRICLRNVDPSAEHLVREACDSLKENGFINFFGLQRFGSRLVRTHQVGAAILRSEFRKAVRLILGDVAALQDNTVIDNSSEKNVKNRKNLPDNEEKPHDDKEKDCNNDDVKTETDRDAASRDYNSNKKRSHASVGGVAFQLSSHKRIRVTDGDTTSDNNGSNDAIKNAESLAQSPCSLYLISGNVSATMNQLPRHCYIERRVLKSLSEDPQNYLGALQQLPKNTLTLHVHAVQSVVWNAVVAYRLKMYGHQPIIGDFVLANTNGESEVTSENNKAEVKTLMVDDNNIVVAEETDEEHCHDEENGADLFLANQFRVRKLETIEDVSTVTIFDVVLPVPGDGVTYPEYLLPMYQQACRKYVAIELEDIKSNYRNKLGSYSGGYRYVCIQPQNFQYHFLQSVQSGTEKLLASDVDRLLGREISERDPIGDPFFNPTPIMNQFSEMMNVQTTLLDTEQESEDPLKNTGAVLLSCTLPKSAYLTMACRELLMGNECSAVRKEIYSTT